METYLEWRFYCHVLEQTTRLIVSYGKKPKWISFKKSSIKSLTVDICLIKEKQLVAFLQQLYVFLTEPFSPGYDEFIVQEETHIELVTFYPSKMALRLSWNTEFLLKFTVWKFKNFSIIQILREITFGDSRSAKSAILTDCWGSEFC